MRPTSCDECRRHFESSTVMVAEFRHMLVRQSPNSVKAELDERLAGYHEAHEEEE